MADDAPQTLANRTEAELDELAKTLRRRVGETEEPQLRAMLETGAEVALGLATAFADYARKNEDAFD